ncbi:protein neprosin-like isoform X1 [Aristolochia californica]|uniref:protein neprosin-like isoform X1 n=2 Tax=Aristolochia californica TaxID=171875 RepID=UPI0035E14E84
MLLLFLRERTPFEVLTNMATSMLLLLIASIIFCCEARVLPSSEEYLEMKRYLAFINRPGLKTIKNEHGEVFDCVEIFKQPAFDHTLLWNHTIQMEPSFVLNKEKRDPSYIAMETGFRDGGCPLGTVPLRRFQMEDLLRAGSVSNFIKKQQQWGEDNRLSVSAFHEYAVTRMTGGTYYGTSVTLNVWNPRVNTLNKEVFSLAQLWVTSGPYTDVNTIEVGWQVYPVLYGNSATRLFIYWTNDGYKTGCYNLRCSGFVQVDTTYTPEMTLPTSITNGNQVEIKLKVTKDDSTGNWWLSYEQGSSGEVWVGYWPGSLFTHLAKSADRVDWGGETTGTPGYSYPPMGSGKLPSAGYKFAAYARNIQYFNDQNAIEDVPSQLTTDETKKSCYQLEDGGNDVGNFGRHFYFGGPGGSVCNAIVTDSTRAFDI